MTADLFHPATIQLLWLQSRGRGRRMWRRFAEPRRFVLSAIACVLAVLWLGNSAMTISFREAARPETLRAYLSLGLVLYTVWHFAKAAFFRPESPFDWTPAERELLAAMPLRPRDLVGYQLASVTVTTMLKAGLFALLLLPDLRCLSLGALGLMLGLLALEILRVAIDTATWAMSRSAFLAYRAAAVGSLIAGGFAVGSVLRREDLFAPINVGEGVNDRLLAILMSLNASVLGYIARPFQPIVALILADHVTWANLGLAAGATAVVTGLAAAVIGLYSSAARGVANREKRNYLPSGVACLSLRVNASRETGRKTSAPLGRRLRDPLRRLPRCGGAGALAWRQLVGARRHWGSVLTALVAPAVLAAAPCFVIADPFIALLSTAGTLAFYTFLLLPTALRFDFRRDLDRLAVLKGLPITPAAAVIGQTFAPVLIATLFQASVLAFATVVRSLPPQDFAVVLLVMIPLNVIVFSVDNLIYLLYPYRMQQEGLEVFLRTMLTFTAKGLLFTAGIAVLIAWGFTAAALTRGLFAGTGWAVKPYAVFAAGMIAGPAAAAAAVMMGLCRTYRNLNPVEDIPR